MANEPRIVFLDSCTMDAGDLDFTPLTSFGPCSIHKTTTPAEVRDRIADATIVLSNKVVLDAETLESAKSLKLIVICATGTNNVDLGAAKRLGITVSNVSGYSTAAVAQHTMAFLLNLATNVHRYSGEPDVWAESPMFTRLDYPVGELAGKTLGIVGLGDIGQAVARIGEALGMRIQGLARGESTTDGPWPRVQAEEFFASSDAVTLHCPLTEENEKMINAETLGWMKKSAFLINTGRGPLVDETALLDAINSGEIAGAGLDVLSVEPPQSDHPLINAHLPNLLVTPHSAWTSLESRQRLFDGVLKNIEGFLDGKPLNQVA